MRRTLLALPAAVLALSTLAACGQEDSASDPAAEGSPTADTSTEGSPTADTSTEGSPTEGASAPQTDCEYTESGQPAAAKATPPPADSPYAGSVQVSIQTSAGALAATLDGGSAPCTVNSFLSLVEQGYYDDSPCHRLTTQGIFVLQCGDPSGTGSGGPGYTFPDELSGQESYGPGTLAMANAGPDTNGSQFFIVYDGDDGQLPPSYTVFGQLDDASTQVVADLAAEGTADGGPDGAPAQEVTIEGATIEGVDTN